MTASPRWHFGPFCLELESARLWRDTTVLQLTPKSFDVLRYLVTHADRVVSKAEILDAVWPEATVSEGVVHVAIAEIRKALGDAARTPRFIATLSRRGYRFLAPVVTHAVTEPTPEALEKRATGLSGAATPQPAEFVPERRHLTVLFCDLVDSTALAGSLDPEDFREVLQAYYQTCATVMQQYEGYIAQYLGDGILGYFGYPLAHEDDAQRAVHAGLGILTALTAPAYQESLPVGERLAVRLGVHTGLVVVGDLDVGAAHGPLALGGTPNIAARLQHQAMPNTLVISAATYARVADYFRCVDLGDVTLPEVTQPLRVYQVRETNAVQSRFEVSMVRGLTPLVGRTADVAQLRQHWGQAEAGMGQVVVVQGEAGIGKSRLLQVLKEELAATPYTLIEWRGSAYEQHSALQPVITWLQQQLQWQLDMTPATRVQLLETLLAGRGLGRPETVSLFAALLSLPLPAAYPPLRLPPQRQKQQTMEAVLHWLLAEAARQPVLFIVEDLHWIDPSTLEFLTLLIDQGPAARLLTLLTCRPEFVSPWKGRAHLTSMPVSRLSASQVEFMIARVARGKTVPQEVIQQIIAKTDGIPLFVEELTKTVLESGLLREADDHYTLEGPLPSLAIPSTLQDSLMARLDRLGSAKAVAQLGATIGRQFSSEVLAAVALLPEDVVQQGLRQLVEVELLYQRGMPSQKTYVFKHALIQDAAYQSLLRRTRQRYHQRIAQVLGARFPDIAEMQPELLAHHYTEAGFHADAVTYWQRAGQRATQRSAYQEAFRHYTTGLTLLARLPATATRAQQELSLQLAMGMVLTATRGYAVPEVLQVFSRAWELCQQLGDTQAQVPALWGIWVLRVVRAEFAQAREVGEEMQRLAQELQRPDLILNVSYIMGHTLFCLGEFTAALGHQERGIALYDPRQHRHFALQSSGGDAGVVCRGFAAWTLWHLGYPDQALRHAEAGVTLAQELEHPRSLVFAWFFMAMIWRLRQEPAAALGHAEAAVILAQEQEFLQWQMWATCLQGWALGMAQDVEAGIQLLQHGLKTLQHLGVVMCQPYMLAMLAEVYAHQGKYEAGLAVLEQAHNLVDATGEHAAAAELHRLTGTLLLQHNGLRTCEAETYFQRALTIARQQSAKAWELRSAVSLGRLWQQQGKHDEARALLAPVYGWFTEGVETVDLQEARALLQALGTT